MQRTFRPARKNLIAAIWLGVFFGSFFIGCLVASVLDCERPFMWLGMAAFWFMWLLLAGYELLAYFRSRIEIDGPRIVKQGVFSTREVLFDDLARLDWRRGPSGGSALVTAATTRFIIVFSTLEHQHWIELVAYLRNALPVTQQTGWDIYCLRCALPAIERHPPEETYKIVNPRREMNRVFAALLIPQLTVTFLALWLAGPRFWPTIVCVPAMWLLFRLTGPTREIRQLPEIESRGGKWLGLAFMALIVGLALSTLNHWVLNVVCSALFVVGMIQFFRCANAENRERQELWKEQAKTADARWTAALAEYKHSAP